MHIYGANPSGGRNVGIEIDGLSVLITSNGPEDNARARQLGELLEAPLEAVELVLQAQGRLHTYQSIAESKDEVIHKLEARIAELRAKLDVAAKEASRPYFFGPVLLARASDDDTEWTGEVDLLDPVRRDRGWGMRFASVAAVFAEYPRLNFLCTTEHGVLLDTPGRKAGAR